MRRCFWAVVAAVILLPWMLAELWKASREQRKWDSR